MALDKRGALDPRVEREVLFHSLIIALTRYVPLPFLDDAIRQAAHQRMYAIIGRHHGRELSREDLKVLTEDRGGCCSGCLLSVLLFPFRKVLARLLVLWDLKKTIDLASRSYIQGYLLNTTFDEELWHEAATVRDAIDATCALVGTSPVEHVFHGVLDGASRTLRGAGELLRRLVRREGPEPREEAVTRVLDEAEAEEKQQLSSLLDRLVQALRLVPESYFEQLRISLARAVKERSG
ncbi:MAG: hypothetical protein AB1758_37140 [Candidatus Eremiobacterota bacterium]